MSIYTYEVDHGDENPSVGAGTEVNGGKVVAVSFNAQLQQNNDAREMLESIIDEDGDEVSSDVFDKLVSILDLI